MGKAVKETDELGNVTRAEYDQLGRLIKSYDAKGYATEFTYDNLGRVIEQKTPFEEKDGTVYYSVKKVWYDNNGNIVKERVSTNASGETESYNEVIYTYDNRNRLVMTQANDGEKSNYTQNYYDATGNLLRVYTGLHAPLTINGLDNVTTGADTEYAVTKYTYDAVKRLLTTTDALGQIETNTYDLANGLLETTTDRNGQVFNFAYNGLGSITSNALSDGTNVETTTYGLTGQVLSKQNGNTTNYEYDKMNRLISENDTDYSFDDFGNRISMTNGTVTTSYTYDLNNRLSESNEVNGDITTNTKFFYDNNGNQITKATMVNQPYSEGMSGDYTILNTSDSFVALYEYNCYNQLVGVDTNGVVSSYAYAPDGLRHSKTVGGNTITFVYDNANVVEEITADGTNKYYRGIEIIKNDDNLYYLYNGQGDVSLLIDNAGTTVADYEFDAYGNQLEENAIYNPFGYRGEYTDAESGLVYLRARMYDPQTGRFINEDPVKDGSNWYIYCSGNPIVFVDPSGMVYVIAWSYGTKDLKAYEQYRKDKGYDITVDADTKDWDDATWKDFTSRSSFARAAYTKKQELIDSGVDASNIDIQRIDNSDDLQATWKMWAGYDYIEQLHFYSHGYSGGAEVFGGSGDFWDNASTLNFNEYLHNYEGKGVISQPIAVFYGCNTANGSFAQNFADTQDVTVYAQTDYASFSHTPKRRSWITTHETSKDVYLYAFESLGGLWNSDGLGKKFSPK